MARNTLAIIIFLAGLVLGTLWVVGAAIVPQRTLDTLDTIRVEVLLVVVGEFCIVLIGLLVYRIMYFPRPRRLVLQAFHAFLFFGLINTGAPFGLSALESARAAIASPAGKAWFDIRFAAPSSFLIFLITAFVTHKLAVLYLDIARDERDHGSPLL